MSGYTEYLAEVVARQNSVMHMHVDDLSQEETLALPPGGNSMNWVLGHIAAHREHMLRWIGLAIPWEEGRYTRFDQGSAPLLDSGEGVSLAQVVSDLDRSQEILVAWFKQVDESALERVLEGKRRNLGSLLGFYVWHEGYHVGQLELLRHVAGRHESII
jgi:uncharacterized damage-inducible protein DinB